MDSISLASPTVDSCFKVIFGKSEEILADLICAIKQWPIGHIEHLTYGNTEFQQPYEQGKSCRMDLMAHLSTGEQVLVELQVSRQKITLSGLCIMPLGLMLSL